MKRAWVTIIEWEGRQVGHIERISGLENWPIYCVNNGWVIPVDYDETNVAEGYEVAELVADPEPYWHIIEDTVRKENDIITKLENDKIKWEENCLEGGFKAKARFNRMLRKYGYGLPEQTYFMETADFATIDYLLDHGAIDQAISLLTQKTEEGAYTHDFKDELIAVLTEISNSIGSEPGA